MPPMNASKCSVEDCKKKARTKGYCPMHYDKFARPRKPLMKKSEKKSSFSPNRKYVGCKITGCKNDHRSSGFCRKHYEQFRMKDTSYSKHKKELDKKRQRTPEYKDKKSKEKKLLRRKLIELLGGKCVSCGEKYDPNSPRLNLEIHHKEYSEKELENKKKYGQGYGSSYVNELNQMFKKGINPKKRFCVLCRQCNMLEAWVRRDTLKAFDAYCWLHGEGYFDKALKDDPKLKKLSEFMK